AFVILKKQLMKKQKAWFFSEERKKRRASSKIKNKEENKNTNFRRPIMFPDDEGHITEYTQIKLSDKQNALLDRKYRDFLKQHKFILDKDNNIIEETSSSVAPE
ncbi:22390_t:CDS:2, partial [Racocetra persica]